MYLVLNNKMFLKPKDMIEFKNKLNNIDAKNVNLIVCPSFIFLPYFRSKNYNLGSQDVSSKSDESYTGETKAEYLKAFDVKYSLVNHFERELYFKENFKDSIDKINNLQRYDITPILCITTDNYLEYERIKEQIDYIYGQIDISKKIIIAYESAKAIREGIITDYKGLNETVLFIKQHIKNTYDRDVPIIYGGSVNKDTVKKLLELKCLDGFLMGKNSIYIDKINEVLMEVANG